MLVRRPGHAAARPVAAASEGGAMAGRGGPGGTTRRDADRRGAWRERNLLERARRFDTQKRACSPAEAESPDPRRQQAPAVSQPP